MFVLFISSEHSIFALTLDDSQDRIYALAAFYDYPNVRGIPSDSWEESWWKQSYGTADEASKVNAINTLFLHFFVAHPDFSEGCAEELINVTFKALPEINQIFLCVPHHVTPGGFERTFLSVYSTFFECCRGGAVEILQGNRNRTDRCAVFADGVLSKRSFSVSVHSKGSVRRLHWFRKIAPLFDL